MCTKALFSSCPSVRRFRMFVRSSGQILLPVQCISNEWFKESQRSLQAIFTSPYCSTWLDSGRQRSRLLYSRPSRWPRHLHRRSSVNSKQRPQKVKKSGESTDPLDPVAPWPLTPEVHLLVLLKWHAGNLCIAVVKYFLFYTCNCNSLLLFVQNNSIYGFQSTASLSAIF